MIDQNVAAVRQFNRFYTQRLGLLHDGGLYAPFSLTAARVLYELAQRPDCTASQLASELGASTTVISVAFSAGSRRITSSTASAPLMMAVKRSCR